MNAIRLLELRQMDYTEYLKSPEWQEIRKEALRRARHRCQICNSQDGLHVHHRTYENRGDEDLSDLTILCSSCHKIFHAANKVDYSTPKIEVRPWYMEEEFRNLIKY